ncbi:DUF4271 domain-containing protein [Flavobacterium restrictum]|uniref:DUF4271 domain-containing protein n=1 Tax=Flavobacterium restrictum TaxID=2594428 RepID=A0A553DT46_9FLAO|nr:DUF4271 domain-containing protein [Flavobacterium restrictum]TRX35909.1 DUF4271 domain-containing protein [Flavobacterium restrictum]
MIENVLHLRITENKDWATVLFVVSFAVIAITKSISENRFGDFLRLIYSDKYTKIYKDSSHLMSSFTVSLFLVQVVSFTFFVQLLLSYAGYASKTDWMLFIQLFTLLIFFILAKFLIEKIIATAFGIEEFVEQFNLKKVTYRTYIGLIILPVDIIFFYFDTITANFPLYITCLLVAVNVLTYLIAIKNYQNLILSKLFYFILYLCTLEIAPYYFLYYWFTKRNT